MKNLPIIKWLLIGIVRLLAYITGLFFCLFIYKFRPFIRRYKSFWTRLLWFYLNDTENGTDAGDFGRYKHNFIGFYRQCALRNSHWNLNLLLAPKKGKIENIKYSKKSDKTMLLYRMPFENEKKFILGYQNATYTIDDTKYFRFSLLKKVFFIHINIQFGATTNRYLYKIKIR
jgi:hypothetical protein